jgi:hypothetical protein
MKKLRKKNEAKIFLEGLASIEAGEPTSEESQEKFPELITAAWLINQREAFDPSPRFIETSTRRLISSLHKESTRPLKRWQRRISYVNLRLRPAMTAILFVISLFLSVSIFKTTISQVNIFLPGDILYPAKLLVEKTQLLVNSDPTHEAQLHSEFARQRALEIEELILGEHFNLLQAPVRDFNLHMNQAQLILDTLPVNSQTDQIREDLEAAVSSHRFILSLMIQKVPYYAKGSLEMVMAVTHR